MNQIRKFRFINFLNTNYLRPFKYEPNTDIKKGASRGRREFLDFILMKCGLSLGMNL